MLDSFGWASLDSAEEFDGLFLFYSGLIPLRLHPSPMWHLCFKPSPIQLYNWLQCYYPYSKTSTDARYSFLFHEISKPANNSASNRKTFHNSKFLKALWIPWKGKGSIQITFFFFFFWLDAASAFWVACSSSSCTFSLSTFFSAQPKWAPP